MVARATVAILLAAAVLAAPRASLGADGPAAAVPVPDATRLVGVLVADTDDPEIGASVGVDVGQVRWALELGIPPARRALDVVVGADAAPAALLARLKALAVAPTDALLVYYAGHGAWADAGPYLRIRGQVLPRADLVAAMRARGAALSLLLTDCCSTYVGETFLYAPPTVDPDRFRDLFFRHRGFVDVTAASRGQVAVGDGKLGGVFTQALVELLTGTPRATLDADHDGAVAWGEAVAHLTASTKDVFARLHPRGLTVRGRTVGGQTPYVFGTLATPAAGPIPPSRKRLGVETVAAPGGGARVAAVVADSPAAWMGLAVGDVIVEVRLQESPNPEEGRPVAKPADLVAALQAAGPRGLVVVVVARAPAAGAAGGPVRHEIPVRLGP